MTKCVDDSKTIQVTNTMMRTEQINRRAGQLLNLNDSNKMYLRFKENVSKASLYTQNNRSQVVPMKWDTGNWKAETENDLRSKRKKMLYNNVLM